MKKLLSSYFVLAGLFMLALSGCTASQIQQTMDGVMQTTGQNVPLTQSEVSMGLKQALSQGINKGATQAAQTDGFYKNSLIRIPFPPDVKKVENTLRSVGLGSEVDKFILSLNRGAEDAAKSAAPIFLNAIKQLTFSDVWNILRGEKDAATQYLKRTTTSQLTSAFSPIMKQSLDRVNATRYYSELVNRYNKIPVVQKVNPDLESYATQKAIDGLFTLVAQEEANIRENPIARTTELLKRVFGSR
ncbi:hypothetical protein TH63_13065 [Rufibacter radiotolerans]|uniref:DUF4197 domain-containing protein n=1 Tax=Rufibacter radiotolerans TaxID=1379910 RepID=A0A0H4VLY3_9BACT|nr:DUF4197 domain-containing protein [Rufibacter radiotolerans]AKQ46343.1 hypothetical protein TH63_13065 [Rufibacter radiotolerans]